MPISDALFEAIQKIEVELGTLGIYGEPSNALRQEIVALLNHMKEVQRKLEIEPTDIDKAENNG